MIKVAAPDVGQEEIDAVVEVLRSGNYVSGKRVEAFEKAFAEYVGTDHAVAVSSGTDALILALFGAQVRPGAEVIVPPLTFFATVAAPIHVGARPVFADIDPETYCLDPEDVKEKLTRKTAAIIPVHIFGHPCFVGNTIIKTPKGEQTIKSIVEKKISFVYGFKDEVIKKVKVIGFSKTKYHEKIMKISFNDGKILEATPNHPIFTLNRGWINAQNLLITDDPLVFGDVIDENHAVDNRGNEHNTTTISHSKEEGKNHGGPPKVYMETNKGKSPIYEHKGTYRTKSEQYSRWSEGTPLKRNGGVGEGIFSWDNRRRRHNQHSFFEKPLFNSRHFNIQYKKNNHRFLGNVWTFRGIGAAYSPFQPTFEAPIVSCLLDGVENNTSSEGNLSIFTRKERTSKNRYGFLREAPQLSSRNASRIHGVGHVSKNKKIESIIEIHKECYVYNLQTESENYFAEDILVHNCAMDELNDILYEEYDDDKVLRRRHKPYVIEDAAQAHGAEYKGKKCGSLGDAACWSFYATKGLTTVEEGGMVTTNNGVIAKYVETLRNHGMVNRNDHLYVGANNRLGEIGGAVGLIQLRKLDTMNAKRTENSEYLDRELRQLGLSWLKLPTVKPYVKHAWFWYPILIDEDNLGISIHDLRDFLDEAGIETRHRYVEPLYMQPALMPYGKHYAELRLPNAERICGKIIGIPNHQQLSREELSYIINVIKEIG